MNFLLPAIQVYLLLFNHNFAVITLHYLTFIVFSLSFYTVLTPSPPMFTSHPVMLSSAQLRRGVDLARAGAGTELLTISTGLKHAGASSALVPLVLTVT